jgi:hypothetical protein
MTKSYETGHARNVENFRRLSDCIISFGASYAPTESRLKLAGVAAILQAAETSLADLNAANAPYLQAISRREIAFTDIPQLTSRALKIAETMHLNPTTIKALKELVRKLYGRRAVPKKALPLVNDDSNAETTQPERRIISVSQLSFDQRIEHLSRFIEILKVESTYQPAETELSVAGLTARLVEMRASNDTVTQADITLISARNARNTVLYATLTGLVDVALDIKKYVLAAFGNKSSEYAVIRGLRFTRI